MKEENKYAAIVISHMVMAIPILWVFHSFEQFETHCIVIAALILCSLIGYSISWGSKPL